MNHSWDVGVEKGTSQSRPSSGNGADAVEVGAEPGGSGAGAGGKEELVDANGNDAVSVSRQEARVHGNDEVGDGSKCVIGQESLNPGDGQTEVAPQVFPPTPPRKAFVC